jgi:Domain of unknown function (DUF5117)
VEALKGYEIETVAHYSAEHPQIPPLPNPDGTPPLQTPPPRSNLPDVRSMQFHFRYSLSELPQTGYRPRLADDRVGYFFTQIQDYSTSDRSFETSRRYIQRWHLEKQDRSSPLSPPKQPIVFSVEDALPVEYRDAIREGVSCGTRLSSVSASKTRSRSSSSPTAPTGIQRRPLQHTALVRGISRSRLRRSAVARQSLYRRTLRRRHPLRASMTRFMLQQYDNLIYTVAMPRLQKARRPLLAPRNAVSSDFCDYAQGAALDAEFAFDVLLSRGTDPAAPRRKS